MAITALKTINTTGKTTKGRSLSNLAAPVQQQATVPQQKAPTQADINAMANSIAKAAGGNLANVLAGTSASPGKVSTSRTTASVTRNSEKPVYSDSAETIRYRNQLQQKEQNAPGPYKESAAVTNANRLVEEHLANKPGPYVSKYGDDIQALYDQVVNRGAFSYDFNADPLYQMYKDQYQQAGQQAAADVQAQAAALSGGYGNSYGATAGSQAYQNYLQQLNNVIPELSSQAFQRYVQEGNELQNKLDVARGMDETNYNRYRDQRSDWDTDLNYLTGRADTLYDRDYGQHRDTVSDHYNDLNYLAGRYDTSAGRDLNLYDIDTNTYLKDRDYNLEQEKFNYQKEQDALAQLAAAASSGGSGGGGRGRSGSGSDKKKDDSSSKMWSSSFLSVLRGMPYADARPTIERGLSEGKISQKDADQILAFLKNKEANKGMSAIRNALGDLAGSKTNGKGGSSGIMNRLQTVMNTAKDRQKSNKEYLSKSVGDGGKRTAQTR